MEIDGFKNKPFLISRVKGELCLKTKTNPYSSVLHSHKVLIK